LTRFDTRYFCRRSFAAGLSNSNPADRSSHASKLVPASGYYEWHDAPDGTQPYYFTRNDEKPITMAGLWDEWWDLEPGERLKPRMAVAR
jgi:hypothetical protein